MMRSSTLPFRGLITAAFVLLLTVAQAQTNVGINTATPDASAALDVTFPTGTPKGMLVPRMTLVQRNAITAPATGLQVYQTDGVTGFYYWNSTAWVLLRDAANTYPNIEVSSAFTSQQSITGLFQGTTFTTLNFPSANGANAALTGSNTWNGTTFTVGGGGSGWYQITGQFVGVASGSNGSVTVGYQVVIDKNNAFGTTPTAGTYPLAWTTYDLANTSLFLKNHGMLSAVLYLSAGDVLNFRAQSWSSSTTAYTSTDGSSNIQITRLK